MERGKQINIHINFSNRWLYTFIIFGILIVAGVSVYAAQQSAAGGTHSYAELGLPSCSDGQVLKWSSGAWACGTDVDTVLTKTVVQSYSAEIDKDSWQAQSSSYPLYKQNSKCADAGKVTLESSCYVYEGGGDGTTYTNKLIGFPITGGRLFTSGGNFYT